MTSTCNYCDGKICEHCKKGASCLYIKSSSAKCNKCGNTICWDCGKVQGECEYCGHEVCPNCMLIIRHDWLIIEPRCNRCKRLTCRWCLNICYTCYNKGDNVEVLCIKCDNKIYNQFTCQVHGVWLYCDKHDKKSVGCRECVYM